MIRTILLYDGKNTSAERIANNLSCLVGFARVADINEPVTDLKGCTGCCLIFNYYGVVTSGNIIRFLADNSTTLQDKRVAVVGIGFSDTGFMKFLTDLGNKTGVRNAEGFFISREDQAPSIGTEIGKMMRAPLKPMPEELLAERIEAYIRGHNTLALATMAKGYIRCTPLEYLYLNGVFYIITEGGNKFRGILDNGQVSAAIFDPFDPQGATKGLQVTGEARMIPVDSDEYLDVLHARGVTDRQLQMLPVTLFLVKIIPFNYEILDSTFAKDGYDSRQFMNTKYRQEIYEEGQRWLHPERAVKTVTSADGEAAAEEEPGGAEAAEGLTSPSEKETAAAEGTEAAGEAAPSAEEEPPAAEERFADTENEDTADADAVPPEDNKTDDSWDLNEGVIEFTDASDSGAEPQTTDSQTNPENGDVDVEAGPESGTNADSEHTGENAGAANVATHGDDAVAADHVEEAADADLSDKEMADTILDGAGLSDAEISSFSLSDSKKAAKFKDALNRVKRFSKRNDDGTYQ